MSKLSKNMTAALAKVDQTKQYGLSEACGLLKEITFTKFDASVELIANLGVDPRKANQMIRGVVSLPHGTGKVVRVLVLCTPDKENEAKEAGADYVGLDEYVEKIKGGWTDVDVIICTPSVMAKVVKGGKIDFKVDKTGIIHAAIGKVSFTPAQICENATALLNEVLKLKPQALKGTYLKSAAICTTMSPGIKIDVKAFTSGSAE